MKNKLVMAALAAALLCGLAFSACKNDVQDVKRVYDKAEAVASVTATLTTGEDGVIVTWDAVDDSQGYTVYLKYGDAKTVQSIGNGSNENKYAANGSPATNTDPNKWAKYIAKISQSGTLIAGTYTFGVRTLPIDQYNGAPSDIVWSNAVTIK